MYLLKLAPQAEIKLNPPDPGLTKYCLKNMFPLILTWTEASRPRTLTVWVNFCVESNFQFEDTKFLRLDPTSQKTHTHNKNNTFYPVVLTVYFFPNLFRELGTLSQGVISRQSCGCPGSSTGTVFKKRVLIRKAKQNI